ncbi:14-3-3 [Olea europaea subsp. europaea]|uniref:14-3-3 n=1 Tax=Olea europaea subsp. europaea TaxID=158383 RepID=A0A8S0QLA7_OLEEU|nr:14-3-3 [Olea europaea subsp. europaea]
MLGRPIFYTAELSSSRTLSLKSIASNCEENIYMAKQTECYEEMVEYMEKVVTAMEGNELTVEECNLLSVAYKNVIGACRASWRIILSIEQKEESCRNKSHISTIKGYKSKIESELSSIFRWHFETPRLHAQWIGFPWGLYEFKIGTERKEVAENTLSTNKAAQDISNTELAPTHPI